MKHSELTEAPALKCDALMVERLGIALRPDQLQERKLVWNLIAHLKGGGFEIVGVWSSFSRRTVKTTAPKKAMELIFARSESELRVQRTGCHQHSILLLPNNGNVGLDIVFHYKTTTGDPDGFTAAMDAFDEYALFSEPCRRGTPIGLKGEK